ncbi:MAG: beta-aspartyl-peptidase [Pseudobdellovibrio sp.]|jgi:beta-aspartyl-dipeptidase (metallo-type)|nr:beta-aspartyl-peptidase [Pseudobdellovibrio sp.]
MLVLFKNAEVYFGNRFETADVLVANKKIAAVGTLSLTGLKSAGADYLEVDCMGNYLCPGFIDSQLLLAGGSGESGFLSQSPRIYIDECVKGGITTVVGTIGVDTITKNMPQLFACVRAFREAGYSAYAYSGGYELPPKTLTKSLSEDILYINEIIGAGEVAIADRRAPEPTPDDLARVVIDSYVAGFLSSKAGVTRIHVGDGKRRLKTIREMMDRHEVQPECLYFTHLERSRELVREGIELARKGCFLDFDIHENDLEIWYRCYLDMGGPLEKLSFSSDAGVSSPTEVWHEIRKCSLHHDFPFAQLIDHMTVVPAKALKLYEKGFIKSGFDADLLVIDKKDLQIRDVMANGKFFMKNYKMLYEDQAYTMRRRMDCYGLRS